MVPAGLTSLAPSILHTAALIHYLHLRFGLPQRICLFPSFHPSLCDLSPYQAFSLSLLGKVILGCRCALVVQQLSARAAHSCVLCLMPPLPPPPPALPVTGRVRFSALQTIESIPPSVRSKERGQVGALELWRLT